MVRSNSRVATLWSLAWKNERISCAVYRHRGWLELRLESGLADEARGSHAKAGARIILTESFDIGPRTLARVQALRRSLKRRGWEDWPS